jgi:hypothetical protein
VCGFSCFIPARGITEMKCAGDKVTIAWGCKENFWILGCVDNFTELLGNGVWCVEGRFGLYIDDNLCIDLIVVKIVMDKWR